jgi:hypothetical protein
MDRLVCIAIILNLLICSLFNEAFSVTDYIVLKERALNDELGTISKEAVVA